MKNHRANRRVAFVLLTMVAGMVGLSFAAVPLYRMFCQVTGYGGTTQVARAAPETAGERLVTVRFDSEVSPGLPWEFRPMQRSVRLHLGEQRLAYYRATNKSDRAVVGMATFNVTPQKAGLYFNKIECFCFTEQRLEPGQSVEMPVAFFVDPEIAHDPNTAEISTVTLSYTFFPVPRSVSEGEGRGAGTQLAAAGER